MINCWKLWDPFRKLPKYKYSKLTWKTWLWRNQNILQNLTSIPHPITLILSPWSLHWSLTDTYPWHLHLAVGQGPPDAVVVDPLPPPVFLLPEILRADTDQGACLGHFRLDATAFVKINVSHHLLVLDHLSHHV